MAGSIGRSCPEDAAAVRSRSLWDYVLALPPPAVEIGRPQRYGLDGPEGRPLHAYERRIVFDRDGVEHVLRIVVAVDQQELDNARDEFVEDIVPALIVLALILTAAAWAQVNVGLKPLEAIRQGVIAIRTNRERRLARDFPDEIMPLVQEVNDLLEVQEQAVARARMRAADLAHGLKTPLTVLANDAHKLRRHGQAEMAAEIEGLVRTMQRHVDHELARVRVAANTRRQGGQADMRRMPARHHRNHQTLAPWRTADLVCRRRPRASRQRSTRIDLAELLGNLVDNAAKWARTEIHATVTGRWRHGCGEDPRRWPRCAAGGTRRSRQAGHAPGRAGGGQRRLALPSCARLLDAYGGSLRLTNAAARGPAGGNPLAACVVYPLRTPLRFDRDEE